MDVDDLVGSNEQLHGPFTRSMTNGRIFQLLLHLSVGMQLVLLRQELALPELELDNGLMLVQSQWYPKIRDPLLVGYKTVIWQ